MRSRIILVFCSGIFLSSMGSASDEPIRSFKLTPSQEDIFKTSFDLYADANSFVMPKKSNSDIPSDFLSTKIPETRDTARRLDKITAYSLIQFGIQYSILYSTEPDNWQKYDNTLEPSWEKFKSNFTRLPVWEPTEYGGGGLLGYLQADGDKWTMNIIGHGLQGSEIYLRMRDYGFNVFESFMGGMAQSVVWEYAIEGWNETPSAVDLTFTPLAGALFGEFRFKVKRFFEKDKTSWMNQALTIVIDPIGAIINIIEG